MTQDTQYKIMKLSSGEEIICNLVADEHPRTFSISSPLRMISMPKVTKRGVEEALSLQRWIHFSETEVYDVPKTQVLVMTNASIGLSKFYEHCIKKMKLEDIEGPTDNELREIDYEEEFEEEPFDEPSSKTYH